MRPLRWLLTCLLGCHGALASGLALDVTAAPCGASGLSAGQHSVTVVSAGRSRSVLVFVPAAAHGRELPLVFDLHGSGGNGESQAHSSRLADVGAKNGFVVANPNGAVTFSNAPEKYYWNIPGVPLSGVGDTPADAPDDVQFISDSIDQIAAQTCIDPRRIYVTGMSGGARMASLLGCRLANRIAAIAPVSGLRAGVPSADNPAQPDPSTCRPTRAMPIISFHGTGDLTNPYDGGGKPYWAYSVPTALRQWVALDHCRNTPRERRVAPHVTLVRYEPCAQGAAIWLYRTDAPSDQGGGHAWPGALRSGAAARPSTEINASELIWQFFRRYRLPAPAGARG
jgi:polyhydroxybutyrate depolymerase